MNTAMKASLESQFLKFLVVKANLIGNFTTYVSLIYFLRNYHSNVQLIGILNEALFLILLKSGDFFFLVSHKFFHERLVIVTEMYLLFSASMA